MQENVGLHWTWNKNGATQVDLREKRKNGSRYSSCVSHCKMESDRVLDDTEQVVIVLTGDVEGNREERPVQAKCRSQCFHRLRVGARIGA